jgi:hypothetical protein
MDFPTANLHKYFYGLSRLISPFSKAEWLHGGMKIVARRAGRATILSACSDGRVNQPEYAASLI